MENVKWIFFLKCLFSIQMLHEYDEVREIDDDGDVVNENDDEILANNVALEAVIDMINVANEHESEMRAFLSFRLFVEKIAVYMC